MRPSFVGLLLLLACAKHPSPVWPPFAQFTTTGDGKDWDWGPGVGLALTFSDDGWAALWIYEGDPPILSALGRWRRSGPWVVVTPRGGTGERYRVVESQGATWLIRDHDVPEVCETRDFRGHLRLRGGGLPFATEPIDRVCTPD